MARPPLRIAYLCDMPPEDPNHYSGGNARILDALRRHAGEVTVLPQDWGVAEPLRRLLHALPVSVNMRARWRLHYALRRVVARRVERSLAGGGYDVLFGAYALHALAGVRAPGGTVTAFTSDAVQTVYRLSEVGSAFDRRLAQGPLLDGWVERREGEALRAADLWLWPSDWLHDACNARYGLDPARAHVVPWGANIPAPPRPAPRTLSRAAPVHLLLIGRNWFAKGGPLAFDTMQALRGHGIDARLTVIGCIPPEFHRNAHVTVHPYLDKSDPAQSGMFTAALAEAHFMVMPSYESYGFAFCEAAAHGLPALCLRVGGVPVTDGVNGYALPPGSDATDFADSVLGLIDAPQEYARLSASAREEYERRLNWDAWGRTTADLLQEAVGQKRLGVDLA